MKTTLTSLFTAYLFTAALFLASVVFAQEKKPAANYLLPFVGEVVEPEPGFIPVLGQNGGLGTSLIVRVIDPVFGQPSDIEFGCVFPSHVSPIGVDCGRFHAGDHVIVKAILVSEFQAGPKTYRPVLLAASVRLQK